LPNHSKAVVLAGMSRRSFAIATVISVLTLGIPLTGCSNPLADAHYNNAKTEFNQGNYEDAIKLLDKAIALSEKPEYYGDRGNTKISLGNFEYAIKDLDKAIEINAEFAHAYYNRAIAKNALEDTEGAMIDYNNAIKYDPKSEVAYLNRGNLKEEQGAIPRRY